MTFDLLPCIDSPPSPFAYYYVRLSALQNKVHIPGPFYCIGRKINGIYCKHKEFGRVRTQEKTVSSFALYAPLSLGNISSRALTFLKRKITQQHRNSKATVLLLITILSRSARHTE